MPEALGVKKADLPTDLTMAGANAMGLCMFGFHNNDDEAEQWPKTTHTVRFSSAKYKTCGACAKGYALHGAEIGECRGDQEQAG